MKIKCSFQQWCLDNNHQDYLDLWDYELNDKSPNEVGYREQKKYWFKCLNGLHESELKIISTYTKGGVMKCNKCNSFGQYLLDMFGSDGIEKYWSNNNTRNIFKIPKNCNEKIFIRCQNEIHPDYLVSCKSFVFGGRCPVCAGKKVIKGINDISTTHPHLVKYFDKEDDVFTHSKSSSKRIFARCPMCGHKKSIIVSNLRKYGICCPICDDGFSYPNKFVASCVKQITDDFETEKTFEWSDGRRYDIYIPSLNCIVENHGEQHYKEKLFTSINSISLEEQEINDAVKKEIALKNGIRYYVVLDCRKSNIEWIKDSILNSALPSLLNFNKNDIDWTKCATSGISSKKEEVLKLYNEGMSILQIAKKINISRMTVYTYIVELSNLNLCMYDARKEYAKGLALAHKNSKLVNSKCVLVVKNGTIIGEYPSCATLQNESLNDFGVFLSKNEISKICRGERKSEYNGYNFEYKPTD